jgi:hypothetical protein
MSKNPTSGVPKPASGVGKSPRYLPAAGSAKVELLETRALFADPLVHIVSSRAGDTYWVRLYHETAEFLASRTDLQVTHEKIDDVYSIVELDKRLVIDAQRAAHAHEQPYLTFERLSADYRKKRGI